ncbi:Anaphase-promoting complex subunit 1 [Acorus calamus]|uniref:Anaphase-promoting complex subunit 1 n=1 Tax=Acorus calamus TaxID=4465 RepID=A0AAV9C505_ACOCL|nr:Anaphase-promoting complex subunit 1 [Acorus calamus]
MMWSSGSRVHKRYTLPSPILKACWCHMDAITEALLCILQIDSLTIYYNASGEVACIPLPHAIASIWPLPFGLLLQKESDENRSPYFQVSSSNTLANVRNLPRPIRGYGSNPPNLLNSMEHVARMDMSSHLILKHPLEEPQAIFVEERGKLNPMKDFDERVIWTSDVMPLVVSYHKGKMQHSVWLVGIVNSNCQTARKTSMDTVASAIVPSRQFSFRRIWQGKCSQLVASKVFLATDGDGVPIICFLHIEQKGLVFVTLHVDEKNNEVLFDYKPHISWSIQAIDAAPVIVTRPRVKVGPLSFMDIIVLASENNLFLYSGKQCLCRYMLPCGLGKGPILHSVNPSNFANKCDGLKIVGLADAIEGRINVIANNGQIFRCALRRNPFSSLASECIMAMAEGLHCSFYSHFVVLLWGDCDSDYLSNADSPVDSEWESLSCTIMKICEKYGSFLPEHHSTMPNSTSWEFLINSRYHKNYCKQSSISGISLTSLDSGRLQYCSPPTFDERERSFYSQLLTETLDSLHALYENLKLNELRKRDLGLLAVLLCQIAASIGEASYMDHYIRDFPTLLLEVKPCHSTSSLRTPPCLFRWLERCLQLGCHATNMNDLPPLVRSDGTLVVSWSRKIVCFYSLLLGAKRTGRMLSSGVLCNISKGSAHTPEELTVLAMVSERFGLQQLDLLPVGVSLPLRHALDKCRESPPTDWPASAYVLVGREDLALACLGRTSRPKEHEHQNCGNLTSISTPYMLHLLPVTVPSSISDITRLDNASKLDADSNDWSMEDGMEHIFNSSTQLRFGHDLRLNEVKRLLSSARPVAVQTPVNPSASDQDLQQLQLWHLAQRTTALPLGRGAFTLATTYTLFTEGLEVPRLVLAGRLPSQQNATVNLDPNTRNMVELRSWPEFHNGVAAGLRLAPFQGKMSRTWISYNKPEEPNVTHAGLLLALGMHGHLRVLTITDVYQYLSQEHDITTVGILLGMAASHRGTMNPAISKMLYLHIPSRHPSSFPELELPTLLQSAALMAVGLLYEGSAHPLTMKFLLGEIGRRSGGDNVLEREGYAVAAGSAMGLVALGRGKNAFGLMETLVDRLFQYVGGKEYSSERSLNVAQTLEDPNRTGQIMDGTNVNIDVTAPGATIAIALIFLKTESEVMASRLSIPLTHFDLNYVRPDFIMLRIIARNMIMWNSVYPSGDWIDYQIPAIIKVGVSNLRDEQGDIEDFDVEALVQGYVNIVTGACISIGLKYAGTRNGEAQELLYRYAVYFLSEIKPISVAVTSSLPKGLSKYVDRGTLETCLHLVVLSLSVVMAGSGHLQTFRLLRYLRSRSSADGHISYGIQMAVSLAIGFLFLGAGLRTFSTCNSAIAALLIALYPRLPTGPNDNRCHLQAFRHLYVLATESRWVQTVDVDTGLPVYAPLEVTIRETENYAQTSFCEVTPCILPERTVLKTVQVCGPRYWPQVIQLMPEDKPWWRSGDRNDPFNGGMLYIKRKVGARSYVDDPTGCQSLMSQAMHKICDITNPSSSACSYSSKENHGSFKVDQLVNTFSADPSLIAFAQLCSDYSWNSRCDLDFQEYCSQVLFECVSKDRPALLQVYISLYAIIGSMLVQVMSENFAFQDSLFLYSLKLALAYNDAVINGKLSSSAEASFSPHL